MLNRIKDLWNGMRGKSDISPGLPVERPPYYELCIQIWDDEEGKTYYSVVTEFSDVVDDHEVVAFGEAASRDHANRLVGAELRQIFP